MTSLRSGLPQPFETGISWRRVRRRLCLLAILWISGSSVEALELETAAREKLILNIETRGFTRGRPRKPVPSPDGTRVYFLRSGPKQGIQKLYVHEVASGKTRVFLSAKELAEAEMISQEEQARRERQRETEGGLTSFELSEDGSKLLVPYAGDLYVVDALDGSVQQLTNTPGAEIDAHWSADGRYVAFVREGDLFVRGVGVEPARRLAGSELPTLAFGTAEFVAQEEMDRLTGHWWSPDSRRLALTEVDTSPVPAFRVPNFNDPTGEGHATPYPKPGDPNARVRLGVVSIDEAEPRWLDLGDDFEYLARVSWAPHEDVLWVQTQPRNQKRLDLRRVDLPKGEVTVVLQEEDPDWVNLHDNFHPLKNSERFLWSSERSGKRQLELFGNDGQKQHTLTPADLNVDRILHVDEERGEVWFTACPQDAREKQLYRVHLATGNIEAFTSGAAWHEAFFHKQGHDVFVIGASDAFSPERFRIFDRNGQELGELASEAIDPATADLRAQSEFLRVKSSSGELLDLLVTRPPASAPAQSLPLIVYVYGGPHGQQVRHRWGGERAVFDRWFADLGFVVARIDGRGAWGRGHDSERLYAGRMGERELSDQVEGVHQLLKRFPEIDPTRVGIWGWSYGGYMTLMALLREPELFQVGVSVAPVVDWRGYDTHYTERYLGLPDENASGYDASSVLTYVSQLQGHLTLVHGASDDNVHMRESMILVNKMVESGKQFDLMIYPGTHMIQSLEERLHLYEIIWRAFAKNL